MWDLGLPIELVVKEMNELPLKDEVKEKWLYSNALRLFEMAFDLRLYGYGCVFFARSLFSYFVEEGLLNFGKC